MVYAVLVYLLCMTFLQALKSPLIIHVERAGDKTQKSINEAHICAVLHACFSFMIAFTDCDLY